MIRSMELPHPEVEVDELEPELLEAVVCAAARPATARMRAVDACMVSAD